MNNTSISRRRAISTLGGFAVSVAIALAPTLPAAPALAEASPELLTWRETLAEAGISALTDAQRERSMTMLLEFHRALMEAVHSGAELEQRISPLRERL